MKQFEIAKGVVQVDPHRVDRIAVRTRNERVGRKPSIAPGDKEKLFRQRVRIGIVMFWPTFGLREANFRRQPRQRPFFLGAQVAIQQRQRTAHVGMVSGGRENELV